MPAGLEEFLVERERRRARFHVGLLTGELTSFPAVLEQADAAEAAIAALTGLVLVPSQHPGSWDLVDRVRQARPEVAVVPFPSAACPHLALLVPLSSPDDWQRAESSIAEAAEQHGVVVFTAGPCEVPIELHERYAQSSPLLTVAPAWTEDGWLLPVDWLVAPYVAANLPPFVVAALERRMLEPLRDHRGGKLLDALDGFFRAGVSPKASARLLGVSEATARKYREQVETITGLDFGRPQDVLWLGLAWLLRRTAAARTPGGEAVWRRKAETDAWRRERRLQRRATEAMTTVGRAVAERRRLRGLTVDQLADAASVDRVTLDSVERGTAEIRLDRLVAIARALDCSAAALVEELGVADYDRTPAPANWRSTTVGTDDVAEHPSPTVAQRFGAALRAHRRAEVRRPVPLVARDAGLPGTMLTHIESGRSNPRVVVALHLADACEVALSELLSEAGL